MASDDTVIETLRPGQAREAGALLCASHAHYPAFKQVLPDSRRHRVLLPFLTASVRDAALHGHGVVARDAAGFVGVALWMPPGTFPLSAGRKARMTPAMFRVMRAAGRAAPAFVRLGTALEKAHQGEGAWYLQILGIHPRAQRRGVGGKLVSYGIERACDEDAPCYLQTSDPANIAYYERFGFTVTQPAIETCPGGPTYIGMARPAR